MTPFPKALRILLENVPPLPTERIRIESATGRILRQDISADRDFPPFDRVMMDGYALRFSDLSISRDFQVAGSAPAGEAAAVLPVEAGTCLGIMTGAPLPLGADCIVPVEETERDGENVRIAAAFIGVQGAFIHPRGSDARIGELLLPSGTMLGSREIGVAASCGTAWLDVAAMPSIAVVATGDELVCVDDQPAPHQIRQSNAHAISAALFRSGHPVKSSTHLRDDPEASGAVLAGLIRDHSWIIITGAISKGARDFIPDLLGKLGCRKLFHGVGQRPGKPAGCWLGPAGQLIMALPGNPVSAITGLHTFVLPALTKANPRLILCDRAKDSALHGMSRHLPVTITADGNATPSPTGNSGDFIGLIRSDGFITIPPRGEFAAAYHFNPWI